VSCETASRNATAPEPGIAPPTAGTPGAQDIDPRHVAEALAQRNGPGGIDPRVPALVPGFDAPFYQAGLAGYSDAAMRLIARRHGCPFCVTEALLDITLLGGGRGFHKADLGDIAGNVPGGEDDHPLSGQIMGSEPAEMAVAAIKMIEQGQRAAKDYRKLTSHTQSSPLPIAHAPLPTPDRSFATIDINLACPVKKIRTKARGGHWLAEPDGAIAILQSVRDALPAAIPVTVKMRRSFDDTPEMRDNFFRIFDAAYDMGCAWVTVHARTVEQKYVGPSRWDLLREIVQRDHPGRVKDRLVFGSGDAWTAADVFRMIAYTSGWDGRPGCPAFNAQSLTGVSIARGCIGNPWIFRQCRDMLAGREPSSPTLAEQRTVLEDHFRLAIAANHHARDPEGLTGRTMRKFGIQFSKHHPTPEPVRVAFTRVKTTDDWRAVLDEHYESSLREAST
jgi:tRNA-dihydrouridine synthase